MLQMPQSWLLLHKLRYIIFCRSSPLCPDSALHTSAEEKPFIRYQHPPPRTHTTTTTATTTTTRPLPPLHYRLHTPLMHMVARLDCGPTSCSHLRWRAPKDVNGRAVGKVDQLVGWSACQGQCTSMHHAACTGKHTQSTPHLRPKFKKKHTQNPVKRRCISKP